MFNSFRFSVSIRTALCAAFSLVAAVGTVSVAQTAPQLVPYTAKLIAGSGTANPAKGAACPLSGYTALDASGDGCLATEILLGTGASTPGPRDAVADAAGNVFFSDYPNALVRRVDAVTGIVTVVAGGGSTAAGTASAGTLGTAVKLSHPAALIFNPNGDLYFSDPGNGQVFKIASTGGFVAGSVGSVAITSGGSGYTTAPTVTFSAPVSGITATGTATISGGVVTGVTITNAGSGYTSTPTISFSAPASGTTATGFVGATGPISLVAGNSGGTYGYGASNATTTVTEAAGNSYLRAVYGLAFDSKGDLFMVDEYTEAILVLNTNTTGSNTVNSVAVPAGQILKIAGTSTNATYAPYCVNGTATGYGCSYGLYTENIAANSDTFDSTYSVAVDSNGVIYAGNEYYNSVFQVSASGILSTFTGKQNSGESYAYQKAALPRAPAGSSFQLGSIFGVAVDPSNNIYIGDASNGVIWRVDAAGKSQYAVAGGVGDMGSPASVCSGATDTLGDNCPALQATLGHSGTGNYATTTLPGPGVYGISVDSHSNLFFADTENNDVREIASGTQFGAVGANQPTQNVDLHFAAGDAPASANAYTLTSGGANFSLGTAKCTTNTDGTTDCILPITATPSTLGPFTGTLQVTAQIGGSSNFALSGTYIQSPVTRTAVSYTAGATCSGTTTYSTTTPVTLTATVTANGPNPPVSAADTITFYATSNGTKTALATVPVTNLGTTTAPVYGATTTYTFSTVGTYTLTAVYSGDSYFKTSTGTSPTTITSSTPSYTITPVTYMQSTVAQGQTALYSFTVAQNVFSGTINFAVTGLPTGATAVLNPSSLTGNGCTTTSTIAFSVNTTPVTQTGIASVGGSGRGAGRVISLLAALGLALLVGLRGRRLGKRFSQIAVVLALLIATSGLIACNTYSINAPAATPQGTYTLTVTATGSVGGTSSISFPLTVN